MTTKTKAESRAAPIPKLLERKIYKTGQTRGADDDVIYQNRVSRSSTVLIPYSCWELCEKPQDGAGKYENGFIVLISPIDYFETPNIKEALRAKGLVVGKNALVFYETRAQWNSHNPQELGWKPANRRSSPLGGQYVARIPATTAAEDGGKVIRGFDKTSMKGAGIRVYEYASTKTINACRSQLESLFWLCHDSKTVAISNGMSAANVTTRRDSVIDKCRAAGLLDIDKLVAARILNKEGQTICPLCLELLSGQGFLSRMEQAEGRDVPDLTVTQVNLFHISELRIGLLGHRPYNIGWGHHHCNVVVKDAGIVKTIEWMRDVLNRNINQGYFATGKSES